MGRPHAIDPLPRMISGTAAGSLPPFALPAMRESVSPCIALLQRDHARRTQNPGYLPCDDAFPGHMKKRKSRPLAATSGISLAMRAIL